MMVFPSVLCLTLITSFHFSSVRFAHWVLITTDVDGAFQVVLVVKNPPANTGHTRDVGSILGSETSPGGRHGNPF